MKVKDIERTASVAWSPKDHHPLYLAAGTAGQQLDASFSTDAALEMYALNLSEPGPDTQLVSSVSSEHRFHKIIWGATGTDSAGTLIGGCDEGLLQIYSASKLIKGENALVGKQQKHTGPVHALDFNSFQQNLFATGAGESEIFIWDLNNTSAPMSPGTKSQPSEDVLSVAWNKQVQHILASSFASKCVIWDLRKNEPIIKLTDTVSRIRWKMVAWHPEVATQLCLASEEDHSPVIQLWDLRFATSPLKTLENHQRGVLAVSWCAADADLLISCGKDDRILCWNPNSNHPQGEVLSEIAKTNQWSFDIAWCPRNPALIASPNYDGHVYVYSIMGGKTQHIQTSNKIADSFPGMEGYAQAPEVQQTVIQESVDPSKAPKWLRRPAGASFGFGGKVISFEEDKENIQVNNQQHVQPGQALVKRTVQISQVITEPELVQKSSKLEEALESGNFIEYCLNKSESTKDQHKKFIWHFLKANFEQNPRAEVLNLLGYRIEDVNTKLGQHIGKPLLHKNVDELSDQFANINRIDDFEHQDPFNNISQQNGAKKSVAPFKIKTGEDTEGLITQALLLNNVEAAVELCLKAKRYADALVIATTGGPELLAKTQHQYLDNSEGYVANLISAIVSEDWSSIINNCDISSWKEALAAILTHASEEDLPILCEQLGTRLENESNTNPKYTEDAQLCYICSGSFERLVSSWSENDFTSTSKLQELVELVSFLQKAIERQGKRVQISGALADLLSRYASTLASQGNLTTALTYLGSSQNAKVANLRDRLLTAIGQKPQNIQEIRHQQGSRRGSTRTSFTSYGGTANMFQPSTQPLSEFPFNQPPPPVMSGPPSASNAMFGSSYNTGLPNPTASSQSWQSQAPSSVPSYNQPPKPFSPAPQAPPLTHPPRPASGSSAQVGLAKPKYVIDPSVAFNNPYGTRTPLAPLPNQPVATFDAKVPSYGNPSYNSPVPSQFNQPQMFQPPPVGGSIPNPSLNPKPLIPSQPPAVEPAQPAINYQAQAPMGWNDPPMVNRSTRAHPPKSESASSEPITHPIFGTAPAPTQPIPNANGYGYGEPAPPPPMQPYNPGVSSQATPYQQQPPQPTQMYNPPAAVGPPNVLPPTNAGYNPGGFNPNAFNQNALGAGQQVAPPQQERQTLTKPPTPAQKPPVPDEHVNTQKVFDDLRNRCSCAANNPQTRRKLEDVAKKLDTLYDCLRYNQLSPNALAFLHQMVQHVENGDYTSGLQLHTQMVQGPDFSQIASFMPGLKVLLQCALQLHVYLK